MLAGVESTMMTSASLALRFAVSHPSLVILDLNLPYVNGDEVGVRIRTRYGRTLPIILVTANRHGAEIAEALEAEYLPKPFNVDQLLPWCGATSSRSESLKDATTTEMRRGQMTVAYAGSCMMCGRTAGYAVQGTFYTRPGGRKPELRGRHLRCADCHGGIIFEPDAMLPPDWIAKLRRDEEEQFAPRREVRRRAI